MMQFDGVSVGSGSFSHLPPSNVAGLGATLGVLHGAHPHSRDGSAGCGGQAVQPGLSVLLRCLWDPAGKSPQLPRPSPLAPPRSSCLHAVGQGAGWGLGAVWCALACFYATRLCGHLLHYWGTKGGVFAGGSGGDAAGGGNGSRAH